MKLLVATRNGGKLAELHRLLGAAELDLQLVGLDIVEAPRVEEDGETFTANARKKAEEVAAATGLPTLADDSGLEVDALGGAPGVRSARFSGENPSDEDNNRLLLKRLENVPRERRRARFRCVLALHDPHGRLADGTHVEEGACEGWIGYAPRGREGFGYDPLFIPEGYEQTIAEVGAQTKDRISHRAVAAARMRDFIRNRPVR